MSIELKNSGFCKLLKINSFFSKGKVLRSKHTHCFICRKAFTVMELIIVVVIGGIIAAFAIPSFVKTSERAKQKRIKMNMIILNNAQEIFKAKNGSYWLGENVSFNLDKINLVLGTNIVNENPPVDYHCGMWAFSTYACEVYYQAGGKAVNIPVFAGEIGSEVTTPVTGVGNPPASIGNPSCEGLGCVGWD